MIIKLLIATADVDYSEYLSNVLSERYAETFEVSVCTSAERLGDMLSVSKYDVALLESKFALVADLNMVHLPMILVDETGLVDEKNFKKVRKYQRISAIVADILENYEPVGKGVGSFGAGKAKVTAVWSPAGGVGKTTVALAYAANKALSGKSVTYLCLENFCSTSVYFPESGKSISKVFEKLDSNVQMFLLGIRQQDSGSGISYFCGPENYDDINVLSEDEIETLINACAVGIDELVIDLSSQCDKRIQKILEMAAMVLLVCDSSSTSQIKLKQFVSQHNVFEQIQSKAVLVNNKGAKFDDVRMGKTVALPHVQTTDPISVFKALSGVNFD